MYKCALIFLSLFTSMLAFSVEQNTISPHLDDSRIQEIIRTAYTFFYPLVLLEFTRQKTAPTLASMNQFFHVTETPNEKFTLIVRPNVDTLYSSAWVDVSQEPVVFTVPAMGDRYYVFEMLDQWSDVFAAPGTRTNGNMAASFALVPICWKGELPSGMQKIECPTALVWILGRIQINGVADLSVVRVLQNGFTLTPLSLYKKEKSKQNDVTENVQTRAFGRAPLAQIEALSAEAFFEMALRIFGQTQAHSNDWPILTEMALLGLVPGGTLAQLDARVVLNMQKAYAEAIALLKKSAGKIGLVTDGWMIATKTGTYGTDYFERALVARFGVGANVPQDAVYPSTYVDCMGELLDGKREYVLHFDVKQLPPVRAFWSVTLYNQEGFLVANELNRYALGDRDALKYNKDGSLDIFIQHKKPIRKNRANWLPAPRGPFNLSARLYWPKENVLQGDWHMPPVIKKVK